MNVRLSPEEKILFQKAATLASLSLSEWVRKVLLAAAQPVKPSEPGEGVLRMEKGKYFPIVPPGVTKIPTVMDCVKAGRVLPNPPNLVDVEPVAVITNPAVPFEPVSIDPLAEGTLQRKVVPPFQVTQVPVTAPPPPPTPEPLPEPVVTQAKMSMVDRMYASIESRQGKPAADFWLMTNKKKI